MRQPSLAAPWIHWCPPCTLLTLKAYTEARKRLGAKDDLMIIYSDEDLARWGVPAIMSHFSWMPVLRDYSEANQ